MPVEQVIHSKNMSLFYKLMVL